MSDKSVNTNKMFAPSTRAVEAIHQGFVEVLNGAATALMVEAMTAARAELAEECARHKTAIGGVLEILDRLVETKPFGPEKLTMMDLRMDIREAIDLQVPGWGRLYELCDACNYNKHICPGCGEELNHHTAKTHNKGVDKCYE